MNPSVLTFVLILGIMGAAVLWLTTSGALPEEQREQGQSNTALITLIKHIEAEIAERQKPKPSYDAPQPLPYAELE
jgi:hypothetical protein